MHAPGEKAPRFSYALAVIAWPVAAMVAIFFAYFIADIFSARTPGRGRVLVVAGLVVGSALAGGAFGFAWPKKTWRWGVWLCAAPVCLVSFFVTGVWGFLFFVALTLAPACAGAYVGARLHLKYVGVNRNRQPLIYD